MKKAVVVIMFALVALLAGAQPAEARNSQGYWVWETLGGDPRKWGGLQSWEEYRAWLIGPKGTVDATRVKLPPHIRYRMTRLVEQRLWNKNVVFGDQSSAKTYKQLVPKGTLLDFLTFNVAGVAIEKVIMNFSAWAYVVEVTEATGQNWKLYTFQECANAGRRQSLLVVTPPPPTPQAPLPPRVTTPFPAEQLPVYNELEVVGAMTAPTVTSHTVSAPGIMGALLGVLGKWLGRPVTNISQSPTIYGSSATGASATGGTATGGEGGTATNGAVTATTAPITVTQGGQSQTTSVQQQQQLQNSLNISNQNANNNVNGANSAGAVNNVDSQTINPIQQEAQDGD